jgi:multiple sugar transport system ATP-binding protein
VLLEQGPQGPFMGEVSLVEPMGNHQVVWLRCAGHALAALDHDARSFVPGQRVSFGIDAARVSLFDPDSGVRL